MVAILRLADGTEPGTEPSLYHPQQADHLNENKISISNCHMHTAFSSSAVLHPSSLRHTRHR